MNELNALGSGTTNRSGAYYANAVSFDGSSSGSTVDALTRTGAFDGLTVDQTHLRYSQRVFITSTTDESLINISTPSGGVFSINIQNSGQVEVSGTGFSGTTSGKILRNQWQHLMVSVDKSDETKTVVYVGDTDLNFSASSFNSVPLDFSAVNACSIANGSVFQSNPLSIAETFLDVTEGDFSESSERDKFRNDDGKPNNLSSLGGVIYLNNAFDTVNINNGSGGDFTVVNSPYAASTSPSD